ncbi:MAG: discoidin domain-containing protein [Planctomycetota bacterium]|nr:discoidin domain-containing protein [Planctomycetota bacterium]
MKRPPSFSVLPLLSAILAIAAAGFAADEKPQPELRTVETYVPYEEFLAVVGKERDATLMTLEEYRALVGLATANRAMRKEAALPPLKSTLTEAAYTAVAQENAVRFDVAFKLAVTAKEWARCDLGPQLTGLGHITLDKEPGWVVVDQGRAYLLVKGAGAHTGTLAFSLPLQKTEDVQKLDSPLLNASTASLRLEVSGRATAIEQPLPLDTSHDEARNVTRFSVALGRAAQLALAWRRKYDPQKSDVLLLADQRISYLLERASPVFRWQARVSVFRRKTDELLFTEPPGGRVVRLTGPNIHSWHRDGPNLRVLLERPVMGDVEIQADGILVATAEKFEVGCPEVKNARQDTRYLALFETRENRIAIEQADGLRELALNETPAPQPRDMGVLSPAQPQKDAAALARLYLVEQPAAKAVVRVVAQPVVFDTQAVLTAVLDERYVLLRGLFAVRPEDGRVYTLLLNVPPPWTLGGRLRERATGRGVHAEMSKEGENEAWTVTLNDAADAAHPLELEAIFTLRDPAWGEGDWQQPRALNFATPSLSGARRAVTYLAISVHPSIDIVFGAMPAWRTETAGKLEQLGVSEAQLRASLVSEAPGGEVRMELTRKAPRGEFDLVTHVLTLETEIWVRSDVRLAVVDRAIDELVVSLPPEAKDPLAIKGPEIKEIAPGAAPNQRRVRFNQPWQGVRILRIEYRAPLAAETDMRVPDIRLEGRFDSRRRIVFQSAGVVELKVARGPGMSDASLEDTPEFARPFRTGRALFAFTFEVDGDPGTYRTTVYQASPTLGNMARQLDLRTVLDPSGVVRTHAAFPLMYARAQYVPVKLPQGATLVALCVDDQNVRPVKSTEADVIKVPLPPRSSARVELVYERKGGALGGFGSWEEVGPDLVGVPVGITRWRIYYPPEYAVSVQGGNVQPSVPEEPRFFAVSFWWSIRHGHWPRWTAWEEPKMPPAERDVFIPASDNVRQQQEQQQAQAGAQQLRAQETAARREDLRENKIGGLAVPEGAVLKADKLGGSAKVELAYRRLTYSRFVSRSVFFIAAVIGLWLAFRPSKRTLKRYIVWGLLLGTVGPPALDWQSPMLAVPFCEGVTLVALGVLAAFAWRGIQWLWRRNTALRTRQTAAGTAAAALLLGIALLGLCRTCAGADGDTVLIPYPKADVKAPDANPQQRKVYVPKSVYLNLMAGAHPEKQESLPDMPTMEDRKNLALASAGAKASGGTSPERLIDGDLSNYAWTSWKTGASFVIELPKPQPVDMIRILLRKEPGRFSRYKLDVSEDGVSYLPLADHSQGQYRGWQTEAFARRPVKSVRLTGTYDDSGDDGNFYVAEVEVLSPPTPIPLAYGNASYELTPAEKTYRCTGTLEVVTFDPKGWVKVPLDFGPSQLVSVALDGQPARVAEEKGVPFVPIQGAGKHKLEVVLEGPLTLGPGRAQLQARFVGGAATRVVAVLPASVELDPKASPPGVWITKDAASTTQRCEIELGASVLRVEKVTIDGPGLDQIAYRMIGDWDIATVTAPDLAEWTVSIEGNNKRLRLWFQKPVNQVLVQITGRVSLGGEPAQVAALSLEQAVRQEGFIGLQHGEGRRFTVRALEGLKRASSQELATMFTLPPESLPDRIYQCHEPPANNMVAAELEPGQMAIETQAVAVVKPDRLLACVRSRYTATGRGPLRHEVELPAGWDIRTVRGNSMRTWEILDSGGKKRLVLYFSARAATGAEVVWSAEQAQALPPSGRLALDLPQPRALADAKTTETFTWVLAADQSLSLSEAAGTTMYAVPLDRAPAWVRLEAAEEYHAAYRSSKPGTRLATEVLKRESTGVAMIVSFLRVAADHVQINARCRFHIEQAGRDRFALSLPAGAELVSLAARNLRSRTVAAQPDGTLVTALLQSPVAGEQIIDLAYRLPRKPREDVAVVAIGIDDADIKQLDHYVAILRAERGQVRAYPGKGLTELPKPFQAEELPFLLDNVSPAALAQVFAGKPDWVLTLKHLAVTPDPTPSAVALAVITTVVAADGGVRSTAAYTVRNRAEQFLRVALPADATLWGVLVDGEPVRVSREQEPGTGRSILRVPIQLTGPADLPINVTLVFESAPLDLPAAFRSFTPHAPQVLDIPVVETYWQVFVPDGYEATRSGGTVREVAGSVLVAGKVKASIGEVKRLVDLAGKAEITGAQKGKVMRSLAREQQELNDNGTVLQSIGQLVDPDELRRIGRADLQAQITDNRMLQQEGERWQRVLKEQHSKDMEEAIAGRADAEQQRAFLDNYSFLDNRWRGGVRYKKAGVKAPAPARGEVALSELRDVQVLAGYKKGELPPPPAPRVTQFTEPLPLKGGLGEETDRQLALEMGATDLRVATKGEPLTFRRTEGHPELTLTLRSVPATWRFSAMIALVAAVAGMVVVLRRKNS